MHWIHFPMLTVMIWSGLLIYKAKRPKRITKAGSTQAPSAIAGWLHPALALFEVAPFSRLR